MITGITHKVLRSYYEDNIGTKLPFNQLGKIRQILDMLDAVTSEKDILSLRNGIHKLKGNYEGFWALSVTGNYRIIFRFHGGDIFDIDYLDYH